jgi:hypothetical protein
LKADYHDDQSIIEIKCPDDLPSYTIEGYYLEYRNIDGKTIHTDLIPPLPPGGTVQFEYTGKLIKCVCVFRPSGFLVIEREFAQSIKLA